MKAENQKEERFISIYQKYVDEVYQFIYLRAGFDKSIAEDLTQDIFLDVFKGLNGFKGLCSERTWIFKIAKNKLYDFYRKQYSQSQSVEITEKLTDQLYDDKQDIDQYVMKAFENQTVYEALNSLPYLYKSTLLLKYIDGNNIKQIAQIIDKTPKATESLLKRAKCAFIKKYRIY